MKHFYDRIEGYFCFRDYYEWLARHVPVGQGPRVTIAEIGVYHGQSAAFLAVELAALGVPAHLHLVDVQFQVDTALNLAPLRDLRPLLEVQCHEGPSVDVAASFDDASLDAVFIDGNHDHAAVGADLAAWTPKVRPGGLVAGHDYFMADVQRAVTEAFARVEVWRGDQSVLGRYWGSWSVRV